MFKNWPLRLGYIGLIFHIGPHVGSTKIEKLDFMDILHKDQYHR